METFSVMIAGVGGQGILLASGILADAALSMGYDVKLGEVHGMAQRGGSVLSEVRFGDRVYSPVIDEGECGLLIAYEPLEAARHINFLKKGGSVLSNTRRIATLPQASGTERYPDDVEEVIKKACPRAFLLDATAIAVSAGDKRALNLVMLGAAAALLPIDEKKLLSAVKKKVPAKALEINLRAFDSGKAAAEIFFGKIKGRRGASPRGPS